MITRSALHRSGDHILLSAELEHNNPNTSGFELRVGISSRKMGFWMAGTTENYTTPTTDVHTNEGGADRGEHPIHINNIWLKVVLSPTRQNMLQTRRDSREHEEIQVVIVTSPQMSGYRAIGDETSATRLTLKSCQRRLISGVRPLARPPALRPGQMLHHCSAPAAASLICMSSVGQMIHCEGRASGAVLMRRSAVRD